MMKKLLLLISSVLISSSSYAQDQELFDNNWYLQNIIINNEDHIPNNIGLHLTVTFIEDTPNVYYIYYHAIHYNSGEIEFIPNEAKFQILELVGLTQGICNGANLNCIIYTNMYQGFYEHFLLTIMEYEIINEGNGSKSLIITRENGDKAIYNTNQLVLEVSDLSTFDFNIYPNPVPDRLSFSSETFHIDTIIIYDLSGKKVLHQPNTDNSLDVSGLSKGMYFVEAVSIEGKSVQKFIKE